MSWTLLTEAMGKLLWFGWLITIPRDVIYTKYIIFCKADFTFSRRNLFQHPRTGLVGKKRGDQPPGDQDRPEDKKGPHEGRTREHRSDDHGAQDSRKPEPGRSHAAAQRAHARGVNFRRVQVERGRDRRDKGRRGHGTEQKPVRRGAFEVPEDEQGYCAQQ